MNAEKLIDFMDRLIHDVTKKVFLILDNLRVHHLRKVQEWLAAHKDKIEVFYLPTYAPEYNPDELVNSDLKRSVGVKSSPRSEEELEHNVRSHLKTIQNNSAKIASFFHGPFFLLCKLICFNSKLGEQHHHFSGLSQICRVMGSQLIANALSIILILIGFV